MGKLRLETSPDTDRLTGYLAAAQHAFIKGQLDVSLDAFVFEITDATVTDEDVVTAAYGGFNPIEHRAECSFESMVARTHETLALPRKMWASDYSGIPGILEQRLREGYWQSRQRANH